MFIVEPLSGHHRSSNSETSSSKVGCLLPYNVFTRGTTV